MSAESAASRDPEFSIKHWAEMKEYLEIKPKLGYVQLGPKDPRLVLSLRGFDFFGKEFSVVSGERTTRYQPTVFENEILCVGGSTTFCIEVSDLNTWPSKLQKMVADGGYRQFRVRNLGIPGAPGLDRLAFVRTYCRLKKGDIVVFLFGDNDAGYINWYPHSGSVHLSFPRLLQRLLNKLEFEASRGLHLAGWLQREISNPLLRRAANRTVDQTIKTAEELIAWAAECGAEVLFVLQPNLLTLQNKDDWDARVLGATAEDLLTMLRLAYSRYSQWTIDSGSVVSATSLFDNVKPSPYMGDWSHVNSRGNELIAKFILQELECRNWLGKLVADSRV